MTGRYLIRNPLFVAALRAADGLLSVLHRRPVVDHVPADPPRRLLLAVGGHLGDAVIASAVIPTIRAAWPETRLGFLLPSWAAGVLRGHPEIDWIHSSDHWKLNRSADGLRARYRHYRRSRSQALREIREVGYDVAIDLYPFYPNSIPILRAAGISTRVGFTSGGFGPLLTHAVDWVDADRHVSESQHALLATLGVERAAATPLAYTLPSVTAAAPHADEVPSRAYLVVHMGAGLALKEWPAERWRSLVDELVKRGHRLVFTGQGAEQARQADAAAAGRAECVNLCDRLRWPEFVATLAGAELVVTVDSVAAHAASALGTPVVVLASGMNRIAQWTPLGASVRTLSAPVPCAPCHRSRGCVEMTCIRTLEVAAVLDAADQYLRPKSRGGGG